MRSHHFLWVIQASCPITVRAGAVTLPANGTANVPDSLEHERRRRTRRWADARSRRQSISVDDGAELMRVGQIAGARRWSARFSSATNAATSEPTSRLLLQAWSSQTEVP